MKKAISLIFALLFAFTLFSQEDSTSLNIPVDETTGLIIYQEVFQEEGSREDLFNRASEWLHQYFANPLYVTKVRDASSGVIKGRHQFELFFEDKDGIKKRAGMVLYSFKIESRDGRYRYTIDELMLRQQSRYPLENWLDKSDPNYNPQWEEYLGQVNSYVLEKFVPSLQEAMKPKAVVEEEEW